MLQIVSALGGFAGQLCAFIFMPNTDSGPEHTVIEALKVYSKGQVGGFIFCRRKQRARN